MKTQDFLINLGRELSEEEKEIRRVEIKAYIYQRNEVIIAVSCKEGILLVSFNPQFKKNIFPVYYWIALMGVGNENHIKELQEKAVFLAFRKELQTSMEDVVVDEVVHELALGMERAFVRKEKSPYKSTLILVQLGTEHQKDIIKLIEYDGSVMEPGLTERFILGISEPPIDISSESFASLKNLKELNNFKENQEVLLQFPIGFVLEKILFDYVKPDDWTFGIREAALWIGLLIFILKEGEDRLNMVFLDRTKLKKKKFYDVWRNIVPSDIDKENKGVLNNWKDWKNFVDPLYKKIKKENTYPELTPLIEIYELLRNHSLSPRQKIARLICLESNKEIILPIRYLLKVLLCMFQVKSKNKA